MREKKITKENVRWFQFYYSDCRFLRSPRRELNSWIDRNLSRHLLHYVYHLIWWTTSYPYTVSNRVYSVDSFFFLRPRCMEIVEKIIQKVWGFRFSVKPVKQSSEAMKNSRISSLGKRYNPGHWWRRKPFVVWEFIFFSKLQAALINRIYQTLTPNTHTNQHSHCDNVHLTS